MQPHYRECKGSAKIQSLIIPHITSHHSSLSDPDCPQITYKPKGLKQPDYHPNHNDGIEDTFDLPVHRNICLSKP